MTDDQKRLLDAVYHINADDYDIWLKVGMALKHEGLPLAAWEKWSQTSTKYQEGKCAEKWRSFKETNSGAPVTGGTLIELAKRNGYNPESWISRAFDWDDEIEEPSSTPAQRPAPRTTAPTAESLPADFAPEPVPPPPADYDPAADMQKYLAALFRPEEKISYCNRLTVREGKDGKKSFVPLQSVKHRTAGQIVDDLLEGVENAGILAQSEGGAFIRFNPMDGKGDGDANVTDYRFCLIESDTDSLETQYGLFKALRLPIAALVHSGNKSLHAITRIEAANAEEYRERVRFVYDYCKRHGLHVDEQDKNASRYSRLAGVKRGDKWQYLIATNIGAKSFEEWAAWAAIASAKENAQQSTPNDAEPSSKGEKPALDARAILPHLIGADLAEMSRLEKKAGTGLNLGLTFYHQGYAAGRAFVKNTAAPLLFKGLTSIAARTGGGKTLFMTSLAAHVLRLLDDHDKPRFHVVFFSLEESKITILKRILAAYIYLNDLESETDVIPISTISCLLRGETIQAEEDAENARQNGRTPDAERIKNAVDELKERLLVIDQESFEEARAAFVKAHAELTNAEEISKAWRADQSATIKALIAAYREKYGDGVLFFVDYTQRVHNNTDERRNAASYKEIQAVMNDFIECARAGATMFASAQMNRDNAKETKNDPAKELWSAIPEQIREAADIEQASEMILYLKFHTATVAGNRYPTTFLNARVLKYRDGEGEQAAAFPIRWSVRSGKFDKLRAPTLLPDGAANAGDVVANDENSDWNTDTAAAAMGATKKRGAKKR